MVDTKNRTELAQYFAKLGFNMGAEIGVLDGDFGAQLCKTIPNLKYFGIDPWLEDTNKKNVFFGRYSVAKRNLAGFDATLIRKPSLEAVKDFEDNSLDFVYIDGNHLFDHVIRDIIEWIRKVKKGGIVSGHDYVHRADCGVIPAVDSYVKAHRLKLNLTKEVDDGISWWFIKRWNT